MTDRKGNDDQAGDDPRDKNPKQSASGADERKSAGAEGKPQQDDKKQPPSGSKQAGADSSADKSSASNRTQSGHPDRQANTGSSAQSDSKTKSQQNNNQQSSSAARTPSAEQTRSAANKKQPARASEASQAESASAKQSGSKRSVGTGSSNGDGKKQRRKRSMLAIVVAVIALLIAVIALAGSAWIWRSSQQYVAELNARVDNMHDGFESSVRGLVEPKLDALGARVDDAAQADTQQSKAIASLRSELKQTRLQVAGMTQQLQGGVLRWQLQQVEHLLITANRRLQLYREPRQASAALKLASKMVARINDPRLFDVRKRIVDSIAALNALPSPDVEGMALTLSAFIEQVPDLPLASDLPQDYKAKNATEVAPKETDAGLFGINWSSGWHRFTDSVGHALSSMVTIRRVDGTQVALLPPDQVYFLTQNLVLQLRSARLALLEGNATLYRKSLSTAIDWLKQYFDTHNSAVKAMIKRLGQMQNVKLDWQPPDISASLFALHDYMQARGQEDDASNPQADTEPKASNNSNQGGE